jgi:hypothetical protein
MSSLVFAYDVHANDSQVLDPGSRRPFLTTRYSVAADFARRYEASIRQVGFGFAPFSGVVADAVAQDQARATPGTVSVETVSSDPAGSTVEASAPPQETRQKTPKAKKPAPSDAKPAKAAKAATANASAKKPNAPNDPALCIECPTCQQAPGDRCCNYLGKPCAPHGARTKAAKAAREAGGQRGGAA